MKTLFSTLVLGLFLFSSCSSYKNLQEPEYRDIRDVRLIKVGVLQTTAGVDLVYYNPNDFAVQVTNARGDMYLDNVYLGHFDLGDKVEVKKRSEFVIPVVFRVDNIGVLKNQTDIYKKKEALIRIDGMARLTKAGFSKEIPLSYQKMQNLEKFRSLVSL